MKILIAIGSKEFSTPTLRLGMKVAQAFHAKATIIDVGEKMGKAKVWQVPFAAGLGALPGCGGAIIVVTQYVSGRLSFGSVVAVLTATMGDAAFLLIAQEPLTGATIIVMQRLSRHNNYRGIPTT